MARKRNYAWFWAGGLLFGACFAACKLASDAGYEEQARALVSVVAVGLSLPFAARARSAAFGALRGAGLGLAGAMGMIADLSNRLPPSILVRAALLAVALNVFCCAAAGGLFAHLARRREAL